MSCVPIRPCRHKSKRNENVTNGEIKVKVLLTYNEYSHKELKFNPFKKKQKFSSGKLLNKDKELILV